jgi:hypothetical protein
MLHPVTQHVVQGSRSRCSMSHSQLRMVSDAFWQCMDAQQLAAVQCPASCMLHAAIPVHNCSKFGNASLLRNVQGCMRHLATSLQTLLVAGGTPCLFANGATNTTSCNLKDCPNSALSVVQVYQVQTPTSCPAAVVQALAKTLLQALEKLPGIVDGTTKAYPVCRALAATSPSPRRHLLQVNAPQCWQSLLMLSHNVASHYLRPRSTSSMPKRFLPVG